jgi:integrase
MSTHVISQSPTLDDIARLVDADSSLPKRRKQDLLSALNTCARVLGRPLANLPGRSRELAPHLAAVAPAAHGLSERSWSNVRSLVGAALAFAGPLLPGRQSAPLAPAWAGLIAHLDRHRRIPLLAGLRWLSSRSVGPADVTMADLEAFLVALRTESLRLDPEKVCRGFCKAWNVAAGTVPGWPKVELPWTSRKVSHGLALSALPASFQADAKRWLARQGAEDLLDELGPPRALKAITLEGYEGILRTSAGALVRAGVRLEEIRGLADLVRLENFKLILRDLWERTGAKPSSTLARRADVLIALGRHYVGLDKPALEALRKAASRVTPRETGLTVKNRDRLRPFDDPDEFRKLANLPFKLRAEVEAGRFTPWRAAERAEMAAAIAILLVAPVRIKNLREIEIGKQLRREGRRMILTFDEVEVKNGVPLIFELDEETAELVTWFIENHRPRLSGSGSAFLFPGRDGGPRTDCGLSTPLTKILRKELGRDINPHLFRHLAAKLFLDANPGQYETVRQLLGHKSIVTTMRFYAGFETAAATKLYRGVVEGLRDKRTLT